MLRYAERHKSRLTGRLASLIAATIPALLYGSTLVSANCQFPEFLQSSIADRKWMSHVVNDNITMSMDCANLVEFSGDRWRQVSNCPHHGEVGSFERHCFTSVQRNRYVVRHYDVIGNTDSSHRVSYYKGNSV